MRRLLALFALLLFLPAGAQAHSGFIDIKDYQFAPGSFTVNAGTLVVWRWDGPDLNHTVTGDFFESDPGKSPTTVLHSEGDTFPVYFEKAGTYEYHCRVHPTMKGTVVVEPAPQFDQRAPKLSHVRARVQGDRVVVDFRIDEKASVTTQLRRDGKLIRDAFRFVKPGTGHAGLSLAGAGSGKLTVRLLASDDAGNSATPRTVAIAT